LNRGHKARYNFQFANPFHYSSSLTVLSARTLCTLYHHHCLAPSPTSCHRASPPPSCHPLSPIALSPLVVCEFEKWVSFCVFLFCVLYCFGVHRFRVQNTPLHCHKETLQEKKCHYHRELSRIHTTPSVVTQTRSAIAKPTNQKTRFANIVATPIDPQTTTDKCCCAWATSPATNALPRRERLHCGCYHDHRCFKSSICVVASF